MKRRILYGSFGIALTIATVLTGSYGISKRNQTIYQEAVNLQEQVTEFGFPEFALENYPVRCYDGNNDYVFTYQNGEMKVEKEASALGAFAGTTYQVDGQYQVIVPTVERFHDLISVIDTAAGVQAESFSFGENEYGDEEQIATIWHEALHAWQFTYFEANIIKVAGGDSTQEAIAQVDSNTQVATLYQQEMECLKKAVCSDSIDDMKSYVLQYREIDERRRQLLPEEVLKAEEYYENVEGMAYYTESRVYELLKGTQAYEDTYLNPISEYSKGTHKYYNMGMAKCLLLDSLKEDWKQEFDFSISLTELLYESCGVAD